MASIMECIFIVMFLFVSTFDCVQHDPNSEVFIFILKTSPEVWKKFDWNKITTAVLAGWVDDSIIAHGHSHGAKVVFIAKSLPRNQLNNSTARKLWSNEQLDFALKHNLDGVNFDFEDPLEKGSEEANGYTKLLKTTASLFHSRLPGSEVSIDLAWAPNGVDGRFYEYKELGRWADKVFVMGYDEQSQMWQPGDCIARPNSPIVQTFHGVRKYLRLGVEPRKIILGVPWYGYIYPCSSLDGSICSIRSVPFRGCNCSDAAGKEYSYSHIINLRNKTRAPLQWDKLSQTPYFEYTETDGRQFQIWFDDPQSLSIKYKISVGLGLGGVGFWTANYLDYGNKSMVRSMWSIVPGGRG